MADRMHATTVIRRSLPRSNRPDSIHDDRTGRHHAHRLDGRVRPHPEAWPQGGRDHYAQAFSILLLGGIKGGQVVGKTDREGGYPEERPISVLDLPATICTRLGIDHTKDHKVEPGGRPVPILKKSARPIQELLG
jgi:Protein of unknown function (DUF1501)